MIKSLLTNKNPSYKKLRLYGLAALLLDAGLILLPIDDTTKVVLIYILATANFIIAVFYIQHLIQLFRTVRKIPPVVLDGMGLSVLMAGVAILTSILKLVVDIPDHPLATIQSGLTFLISAVFLATIYLSSHEDD